MVEVSRRELIEERLRELYTVTSADVAYDIIDSAFTPPPASEGEALATWVYHAERSRRQMVGAIVNEKIMAAATPRLCEYVDEHGSVVVPATREHLTRSPSLQNFVTTMNYWITDTVAEVVQADDTAKALVEAGNRRHPLFRQAVIDWLVFRHRRGKNLDWQLPRAEADTIADITSSYRANMTNEVINQFLVLGQDVEDSGLLPAQLAYQRLHGVPRLTSAVHEVSRPVMGPFITYDPETGDSEHRKGQSTPQTLYSTWEREQTAENAQAFLSLAQSENVKNLLATTAHLPGSGPDGRALNPGHCHVDIRIINEEAFSVPPRELLIRLGATELAHTEYLNVATLVGAIGCNAATHTFYSHWPEQ